MLSSISPLFFHFLHVIIVFLTARAKYDNVEYYGQNHAANTHIHTHPLSNHLLLVVLRELRAKEKEEYYDVSSEQ